MTLRRSIPFWAKKKKTNASIYDNMYLSFSLRKLNPNYTGNCVRVRRESDNTEQDFGFVGGVVDYAGIASFCGASRGFVTRGYFQNDVSALAGIIFPYLRNTVNTNQPLIYNGSTFFIYNTRYYLDFSYQVSWLDIVGGLRVLSSECFSDVAHIASTVYRSQSTTTAQGIFEERDSTNSNLRVNQYSNTTTGRQFANYRPSGVDTFLLKSTQLSGSTLAINTTTKNTSNLYSFYHNGTFESSITDTRVFANDTVVGFGRQDAGTSDFRGQIAEFVVFKGDPSAILADLMNDQKTYYGI